jgi:hypothetical protein
MLGRLSRWAPLTGVLAAVLGVAGSVILILSNAPGSDASGQQVLTFYEGHGSTMVIAAYLMAFAFGFLVLFAGSLGGHVSRTSKSMTLAILVPATSVVLAVGQIAGASSSYALANLPSKFDPAAAQAINVLPNDFVLVAGAGIFLFGLTSGVAILRGADLPKWLGWVAIVMAILEVSPVEGFAYIVLVLWMVVVSVLIALRSDDARPATREGGPA